MPRVIEDRRADGFARLGVAGARGLGLPASRSRALEIEVPDLRWRAAVERFATELLARFAREAAPLGVDTIRIVDARSC